MIPNILIGIGVVLVVFLIIVAMQPPAFKVERATNIMTPPGDVFAYVNDFHKWGAWSPWEKLDPDMKRTYSGPDSGVGAGYSWVGNSKVGEGRMTITDSKPNELVRFKLEFIKPMAAVNTTDFVFKPEGGGTGVTWTMSGQKNFMMKAFCMFVNMDKMVGGDFEKGLAAMKAVAEKRGNLN